jgi:hypothetical protein
MGHRFLQQLPPAEADALAAQGFPPIRTYVRDPVGRIWTCDQIPLERAPALLYLPPERWAMLQTVVPASAMLLVDLPEGWSRITRRRLDGTGGLELVPEGPRPGMTDGFYQRWRDGQEIPS